jgi:hypothetical protein
LIARRGKPMLPSMTHRLLSILIAFLVAATIAAQTEPGPYARIAVLRPHDGRTVDFEAGYIRHLEWHRKVSDSAVWYGWTVWAGERQRWFVYATFGHSAASLDNPVLPADDERDNIVNVTPHAQFVSNAVYEFLPRLSKGGGIPRPLPRMELLTIELAPGSEKAFELAVEQSKQQDETLWYRLVAGGSAPRYVRLRARPSLAAVFDVQPLPEQSVAKMTVEILSYRPTLSYRP